MLKKSLWFQYYVSAGRPLILIEFIHFRLFRIILKSGEDARSSGWDTILRLL